MRDLQMFEEEEGGRGRENESERKMERKSERKSEKSTKETILSRQTTITTATTK